MVSVILAHPVRTALMRRYSRISEQIAQVAAALTASTVRRSTRSSSLVTLARPSTSSSLRITDRSFHYASPRLWNQLTALLRQPRTNLSNSASTSCMSGTCSIGSIDSPLSSSITHSLFHSRLKTFFSANPSHRTPPFLLQDWLHGFPGLFTDTSEHSRFFLLFSFFCFPLFSFWFRVVD